MDVKGIMKNIGYSGEGWGELEQGVGMKAVFYCMFAV